MLTPSHMVEAAIVPLVPCVSVEKLSMASWDEKNGGSFFDRKISGWKYSW